MRGSEGTFWSSCGAVPRVNSTNTPVPNPGSQVKVVTFAGPGGNVWFSMVAGPGTTLRVNHLTLTKTSLS